MIKEINLAAKKDIRGALIAIDDETTGFDIKRIYYIYGTNKNESRGFHAHYDLKQLFICMSGSCKIKFEYEGGRSILNCASLEKGILVEGIVWREIYDFSEDCVLMVIASDVYKESDYIRDYDKFKEITSNNIA